jgi:choline kinase
MIAVILAAGVASRLRPLTDERPKCLLEVGGRTLLQRTFDALMAAGIRDYVVVTGYRGEMIREFLTDHYDIMPVSFLPSEDRATVCFVNNPDYATTNNIYSLWLTRPYVSGMDFLLLDSDILFDPKVVEKVLQTEGNVLALNRHELGEEEIKVITDEEGKVTELSKTCSIEKAIGESIGIEKIMADYSMALFQELKLMINGEKQVDVFYERAFERLIPQGHHFGVVDTTEYFSIELDTVDDFQNAQKLIPKELF